MTALGAAGARTSAIQAATVALQTGPHLVSPPYVTCLSASRDGVLNFLPHASGIDKLSNEFQICLEVRVSTGSIRVTGDAPAASPARPGRPPGRESFRLGPTRLRCPATRRCRSPRPGAVPGQQATDASKSTKTAYDRGVYCPKSSAQQMSERMAVANRPKHLLIDRVAVCKSTPQPMLIRVGVCKSTPHPMLTRVGGCKSTPHPMLTRVGDCKSTPHPMLSRVAGGRSLPDPMLARVAGRNSMPHPMIAPVEAARRPPHQAASTAAAIRSMASRS